MRARTREAQNASGRACLPDYLGLPASDWRDDLFLAGLRLTGSSLPASALRRSAPAVRYSGFPTRRRAATASAGSRQSAPPWRQESHDPHFASHRQCGRGTPSLPIIVRVARSLSVEPDELLFRQGRQAALEGAVAIPSPHKVATGKPLSADRIRPASPSRTYENRLRTAENAGHCPLAPSLRATIGMPLDSKNSAICEIFLDANFYNR